MQTRFTKTTGERKSMYLLYLLYIYYFFYCAICYFYDVKFVVVFNLKYLLLRCSDGSDKCMSIYRKKFLAESRYFWFMKIFLKTSIFSDRVEISFDRDKFSWSKNSRFSSRECLSSRIFSWLKITFYPHYCNNEKKR